MKNEEENSIKLVPVGEDEQPEFLKKLQESFAKAVIETFGDSSNGPIPPDEVIYESFNAKNAETYHILWNDKKVGGVVLQINNETHHNSMDLLFLSPEHSGRGIGFATWKAIVAKYPKTEVWELVTPYFEKRNIHFYVNKCGFRIVEFFNAYHPDPHDHGDDREESMPGRHDFFRFEKVMKE